MCSGSKLTKGDVVIAEEYSRAEACVYHIALVQAGLPPIEARWSPLLGAELTTLHEHMPADMRGAVDEIVEALEPLVSAGMTKLKLPPSQISKTSAVVACLAYQRRSHDRRG
jgi:hypothetical protein